ncbi:MAG TPA: hypothetical protein VFQ65_23840 [Kofleriaceae bacterium]|nr:hypothetical protein [Kofleriaceae bacterium]
MTTVPVRVSLLTVGMLVLGVARPATAWAQAKQARHANQLTYSLNMDPSFSPDGKKIVYISVISGVEQLFTMNVDGSSRPVQLTHDDADHEDPAWSPLGDRIAFRYMKGGAEIIYVMNADGSHAEAVSPRDVLAIHPTWSSDGTQLVYCTEDDLKPPKKNPSEIDVIDLKTKKVRTLLSGGVNTYPVWSPDGKKLAFRRMIGEMNSEVFVANSDGSDAKNITNHPAFDGWPTWSPDGTQIAFASNRRSSYQIFAMNADGSQVRLIANTEGRATSPKWSPDGKTIMFTNCRNVDFGVDCQILTVDAQR